MLRSKSPHGFPLSSWTPESPNSRLGLHRQFGLNKSRHDCKMHMYNQLRHTETCRDCQVSTRRQPIQPEVPQPPLVELDSQPIRLPLEPLVLQPRAQGYQPQLTAGVTPAGTAYDTYTW